MATTAPAQKAMTPADVRTLLPDRMFATDAYMNDGVRIHVWYKAFRAPTAQAVAEAAPARELDLPRDHYTGKLVRVWEDKKGDTIITMRVELERDMKFRSFNVNSGQVLAVRVLGR